MASLSDQRFKAIAQRCAHFGHSDSQVGLAVRLENNIGDARSRTVALRMPPNSIHLVDFALVLGHLHAL